MSCILALDQGTTSSRALVFNAAGEILGLAQKELRQYYPQNAWVEHDPLEIYSAQLGVAHEALAASGVQAADVSALGITNQRETTLLWERKTGRPIYPAIVWQDRRTVVICEGLKERGLEPLVQEKTGLIIDPYFSASKIIWLLDNLPEARQKAEAGELAFGTIDSWLVYKLTRGALHLTDVTNASRTMLFNIHTLTWDEELLAQLNIPAPLLPEVKSSSEVYGETAPGVFAAPIKIAGIAGDQHAATFGQRCTHKGMVKNTYGTGCFTLLNVGDRPQQSQHQLLSTVAWQLRRPVETAFALEGSVFVAGAAVQWLRDGLGLIRSAADVEELAASVPDNGGVSFVPAFTGLGAPQWQAGARGTLLGLTRGTTSGHIARATLEAIALQVADLLAAMKEDTGVAPHELRVDGGASRNDLLLQLQADVLGIPIVRAQVSEVTALGAAYLAGLAVGTWQDSAELDALWQEAGRFEPHMPQGVRDALVAQWKKAVATAARWQV